MAGLFLILPIAAFDVWLACTTGPRQWAAWRAQKNWRQSGLAAAAGILLAFCFAYVVKYKANEQLRVQGFPIPAIFFHLDGNHWTPTPPQPPLSGLSLAVNFLTGLVAPFFPFKVAEFLKTVKTEIK